MVVALRAGLAGLFAYFGVLAVMDPARQQAQWVASWIQQLPLVGSVEFIFLWGMFQIALALALLIGFYLRYTAAIAAAALIGVSISVGLNEIAYRDVVLALAALVVASSPRHAWACTA